MKHLVWKGVKWYNTTIMTNPYIVANELYSQCNKLNIEIYNEQKSYLECTQLDHWYM